MAGRLVGEVMDAAPVLRDQGVKRNGFDALLVVAEKCDKVTRVGRVPLARVAHVLGVSERTSTRVMSDLVTRKLIVRVQRGHRFAREDGDRGVATAYYLCPLTPESHATHGMASDSGQSHATHRMASDSAQSHATSGESHAIPAQSHAISRDGALSVDSFRGLERSRTSAREALAWQSVPCPTCSALAGKQCRNERGGVTSVHDARRRAAEQQAAS